MQQKYFELCLKKSGRLSRSPRFIWLSHSLFLYFLLISWIYVYIFLIYADHISQVGKRSINPRKLPTGWDKLSFKETHLVNLILIMHQEEDGLNAKIIKYSSLINKGKFENWKGEDSNKLNIQFSLGSNDVIDFIYGMNCMGGCYFNKTTIE